ncbi:YibE/F family protein, partial [Ruminococcaceae bacterium OttesenSCG-928-L11]|nr:YibE/F family protein [Ruminococcaceae bacterium OttesenSCG-928-L11]
MKKLFSFFNRSRLHPFVDDETRQKRIGIAVYILTVVLSIVYIVVGHQYAVRDIPEFTAYSTQLIVQAKVVSIGETFTEEQMMADQIMVSTTTLFTARVTEGEFKDVELEAMHLDDPFSPYHLRDVRVGDNVFLQYSPQDDVDVRWVLQEYRRTDTLLIMGIFVFILMIVFGRSKGVHTIVALVFTCLAIFAVFIPAILSGKNIYLFTVMTGAFIIAMTILVVNGANRKSLCSGIGCMCGFAASGILSLIMDRLLGLTGLIDEDSVYLLYLNTDQPINLNAIIFAAITIGALGAIMDVSISISSSLNEVFQTDPWLEAGDIMRSGMNIGRDIIGTMSNTLLLAYIGSSLSLVVLLIAYNDSLAVLLNKEMIVVEILQSLVGVAGLLLVIPLTSFVCSIV